MATNPYVNKVEFGNQTVMDITDTTAEESDVASGKTFYKASGARSVGTATPSGGVTEDLLRDTVGWTGKNLLEITASTQTLNDVTLTVNADGSVTVNGTASALTVFYLNSNLANVVDGEKYIISGCPSGGGSSSYRLEMRASDDSIYTNGIDEGSGSGIIAPTSGFPAKATIRIASGYTASNVTFYPMLRKASVTDSTYEPYHENVDDCKYNRSEANVLGAKNLLPNTATTQTINDVTFTVNADGTVTANGTASADISFNILDHSENILKADTPYILSGCPSGGTSSTYMLGMRYQTYDYGSGSDCIFTSSQLSNAIWTTIFIKSGVTVSNLVFKPMLRLASDNDDTYVPYAMTNKELTEKKYTHRQATYLGAKNLLPTGDASVEKYGVTFTRNADGSITANGTAVDYDASYRSAYRYGLPSGNYIITGAPEGAVRNQTYWLEWWRGKNYYDSGSPVLPEGITRNYDSTQLDYVYYTIHVKAGQTVSNVTFYPMMRFAEDSDDTYAPYSLTNRELTAKTENVTQTIELTKAEYDALSSAQKHDTSKVYYVYDENGGSQADCFTQPPQSMTGSNVVFDNLNPNYGYKLFYVNTTNREIPTPKYTKVTQANGTSSGTIKLTYAMSGYANGDTFCLRVFK